MDPDLQHVSDKASQQIPSLGEDRWIPVTEWYHQHPVLFAFVALVIVFVSYQLVGGGLTVLLFGTKITNENLTGFRLATMLGQILFLLIPTLILTSIQTKNLGGVLRLHPPRALELVLAILGVFSLQGALQVYVYVQDQIPIPHEIKPYVDEIRRMIEETYRQLLSADTIPELVFVLVIVALTPAFCEEFLFRGLVQKNLEKGLKPFWGITLGALIFGGYHLNPFMILPLTILGLYFGFLVYRTNSIYVPITAHFFNNFAAGLSLYLIGDEDLIIPKSPSGEVPAQVVVSSFLLLVGIFLAVLYVFIKITAKRTSALPDAQSPS